MSAHQLRKDWQASFAGSGDSSMDANIRHVANYLDRIGPPYGQEHHDWVAIRSVVLREGRKRGLNVSAIAPT